MPEFLLASLKQAPLIEPEASSGCRFVPYSARQTEDAEKIQAQAISRYKSRAAKQKDFFNMVVYKKTETACSLMIFASGCFFTLYQSANIIL
jgi:hypothetical protein